MESSVDLANRFREVILDGRWIANTNYKDQLSPVTFEQATTQIGTFNSLAALAFHVNYYLGGILNVFEGGELEIKDKYSFDLPPLESAEDWNKLLTSFWDNAEKFAAHVESFSEEKLAEPFVLEKYGSYRRNIEGFIEHSYYHLGQVSLLKKMILNT